ncbi:MAG TPA: 6,7-dimethyl-8-ribityllumazine synthase [Polyangia bacterium]|nr:6,7-dimethyl-8-ribityllumazine synthase [Polyangia bacterium]
MSFQPGEDSDTARLAARHAAEHAALGRTFAIVASRFNDAIVERLVAGARGALRAAGAAEDDVAVFRCPGALELPGLVRRVVELGRRLDGVVVLGCVIRGDTPHFDLVVGECTRGVGAIAAEGKVAIANGVLACNTLEQAVARAAPGPGNRGAEAATVAVEMAEVYAGLDLEWKAARAARTAADPVRQRLPK